MPSEPSLQTQGGVYLLIWKDEQIQVRIDRLHAEKAGIYGELLITTTAPGSHSHIHGPVHFNLISTTARRSLVTHLTESAALNWAGILEQACYIVVEEHRQGVPAVNIADYAPSESLGMRIAPILQERMSAVFYGEGDSLKSFFATYLAVLVRTGQAQSGLTPEPGKVLFLDYETDLDTFWERVNMLTAGMGMAPPDGLLYRPMVQSLVEEFPRLNQITMDNDIGLIIVDSAAPATVEPEKAEYVIPFFRALRSLNTTNIVIAHMTKSSAGRGDYPFGSTMWRNLPRANFMIKADRHDNDVAISLKHTKANNGRRLAPMGFKFAFTEDDVRVSKVDAAEYIDLAQDVGLTARIKRLLEGGAMNLQEITEGIHGLESENKTTVNSIKSTLSRGSRQGHFLNINGDWGNAVNDRS